MPGILPWDRFRDLPGPPDQVFESLCRAIVQRNHGGCGQIRSRRNQPGVEFFMRLEVACDLGEAGRVYGWSCKWFPLPDDNELTQGRQRQIEESIDKAKRHVEGLTDFVLCLPELPAKKDLDWYFGLEADKGLRLHLWADEELEARMSGGAEILRRTFFGELVLTPATLATAHERAVAPIAKRWIPALHVTTHVEHDLRLALARPHSLDGVRTRAATLLELIGLIANDLDSVQDADLQGRLEAATVDLRQFADYLTAVADALDQHRPVEAQELVESRLVPDTSRRDLWRLVRDLRKRRVPMAVTATALEAEIRGALRLLDKAADMWRPPMFAVVGAAGYGKTQLAAEVTSTRDYAIAGVFVLGGHLRAGATLDDLVRRIPGLEVTSFEDLLAALDAAGARAGSRVPLVIDGLNEAERPTEWRLLLEQLLPVLPSYPNVLLVVTLREALKDQLLPEDTHVLGLEWEESEVWDVVHAYFDHYLIEPGGAWLPTGLFHNPLFVRMYCEAANGDRKTPVGVEALPTSLVGVFELYRGWVAKRLANDPARPSLPRGHVERQLARLALALWEQKARLLPFDEVRTIIDGGETSWDDSLYRRLEEEGILFRDERAGYLQQEAGILFDRFAGYLVSDAVLAGLTLSELDVALSSEDLWGKLTGETPHPLAEDALVTLVGLLPRRFYGKQLWKFAPETQTARALGPTLSLESHLLDDETVDSLADVLSACPPPRYGRRHPFDRLWEVHNSPAHQLNARFLDRVLRTMALPQRDRVWTEWLRLDDRRDLLSAVREVILVWEETDLRDERDDLSALAIAWMLTSTNLVLRDTATKALQRFGRPAPDRLFAVAAHMLDVDDPYVVERILAATFGATAAHQMPDPGGSFERALTEWLVALADRYLVGGSTPTSHELTRTYISATFEFAATLHPTAVPEGVTRDQLMLAAPPPASPISDDDERAEECDRTFGMDFENYVIGSAIEGRGNYQREHAGYVEAIAEVRGRVWELGWRSALFAEIDRRIAEDQWHGRRRPDRVERYGKKYGWIAYYELVGRLDDEGKSRRRAWIGGGRIVTPDIDPTFPDEPPPVPLGMPEWVQSDPADDATWIRSGEIDVPPHLWTPERIGDSTGPWILVEGFLKHRHEGRRVFGFFRTLLVDDENVEQATAMINNRSYLGNDFLPGCLEHRGIYAGEMPWSSRFSLESGDGLPPNHRVLQEHWEDPGFDVELVATEYAFEGARTATVLSRSYVVPSYEFALHFGLRQLPGTLDLVMLDGTVASLVFRADEPWSGYLLYVRKDLIMSYADRRRILLVAWGEREVTVEWDSPPSWFREVHAADEHLWREVVVLTQ